MSLLVICCVIGAWVTLRGKREKVHTQPDECRDKGQEQSEGEEEPEGEEESEEKKSPREILELRENTPKMRKV